MQGRWHRIISSSSIWLPCLSASLLQEDKHSHFLRNPSTKLALEEGKNSYHSSWLLKSLLGCSLHSNSSIPPSPIIYQSELNSFSHLLGNSEPKITIQQQTLVNIENKHVSYYLTMIYQSNKKMLSLLYMYGKRMLKGSGGAGR